MTKVSKKNFYTYLQKHFAGKYVATNKEEDEVLAVGESLGELEKQLKKKGIDPENVIYSGPIQEYGRRYVYHLPI